MITAQDCKKQAKQALSEKRYRHTLNVAKMAKQLCKAHNIDPQKAEIAALLHDYMKEQPKDVLLQLMNENVIIAGNAASKPPCVWHGVCAAITAKNKFGIEDKEILSAMCCHTCGKENMSVLDKIIFLADMVSEERDFLGVKELRALAMQSLDDAMIKALQMNIGWLEEENRPVDEDSRAALDFLIRSKKEKTSE
ncbi:MAG: bis(5'-nucleosyl)-tetraphosphatase (symmetrical) YqeK [Oscillospiraceae bacterium]|nr:bis(5'-nucleosyl)-tetraphosphatase (symmetrical) YqeK [Oscillospiraceae bacterium]